MRELNTVEAQQIAAGGLANTTIGALVVCGVVGYTFLYENLLRGGLVDLGLVGSDEERRVRYNDSHHYTLDVNLKNV